MSVETAKKRFLSRGLGMVVRGNELVCHIGNAEVRVPIVGGEVSKAAFDNGLDQVSAIVARRR